MISYAEKKPEGLQEKHLNSDCNSDFNQDTTLIIDLSKHLKKCNMEKKICYNALEKKPLPCPAIQLENNKYLYLIGGVLVGLSVGITSGFLLAR